MAGAIPLTLMKRNHRTLTTRIFATCVTLLETTADRLDPWWPGGMDYQKLNVILFCLCLPLILIASLVLNVLLLLAH